MLSDRFDNALAFAHQLHREQKRKTSGAPYIAHLLGVCSLVVEDNGSEDEAIAALLHDSLEDQGHRYPGGPARLAAEIEARFGPEVLRIVDALTERPGPADAAIAGKRARWRAHKLAYIDQILSADSSVLRVSTADSLYNVRTLTKDFLVMGDDLWSRFLTRSRDDQLWAYDAVARAFLSAANGPLALALDRAVSELFTITGAAREKGD